MPEQAKTGEKVFRGIAAAGGVGQGRIVVVPRLQEAEASRYLISEEEISEHIARLEQALTTTRQQLLEVQRKVSEGLGAEEADIFDWHLLTLEDPVVLEEITRLIQRDKLNVEQAFSTTMTRYMASLSQAGDEYLRERVVDVRDVTQRVLRNLLGCQDAELPTLVEPRVLVAYDLTPSQTAQLNRQMVLGFAIDLGTETCHTAILARALQLPAVVGLQGVSQHLRSGEFALVDGFSGLLILNPTDQTLFEYGKLVHRRVALRERLRELKDLPAVTLDGHRIILSANIESPEEAEAVRENGAEGVGLFRTEYMFLNRRELPGEQEQYEAYCRIARALYPQPVIARTLDLGGDKLAQRGPALAERNPFLGWRAIRMCLQERDLFRDQLRAILRASTVGNLKLMYPMISGLEEVTQANALLEEYKEELRAEQAGFAEDLEVGIMVEIPSAAVTADALAKRVKFFSLGTNDLIQYTLGIDRMNPKIAHLYEPTHPAVLGLIKTTVEAAHANGIWVGICGEMAGDPLMAPLLLGLGVDELSAAPTLVPAVKHIIRRTKLSEAKELAQSVLTCDSGAEIHRRAGAMARDVAPDLFEEQAQ
jgi:phosphotransferase system enzyme I (PtsI)